MRSLPEIPDPRPASWTGDLQMLPDGSLLAAGAAWELLRPGAQAWCPVPRGALPAPVDSRPLVDGPRLWWAEVEQGPSPAWHWRARSIPLAALRC